MKIHQEKRHRGHGLASTTFCILCRRESIPLRACVLQRKITFEGGANSRGNIPENCPILLCKTIIPNSLQKLGSICSKTKLESVFTIQEKTFEGGANSRSNFTSNCHVHVSRTPLRDSLRNLDWFWSSLAKLRASQWTQLSLTVTGNVAARVSSAPNYKIAEARNLAKLDQNQSRFRRESRKGVLLTCAWQLLVNLLLELAPFSNVFFLNCKKGFQLRYWANRAQFLQRVRHYDLTQKYGTVFWNILSGISPTFKRDFPL